MNINNLFPSKYLKAADLPEDEAVSLKIAKIKIEEVGKDKDTKPVIYFEGEEKGFVANKTNCRAIAALTGSEEVEEWVGQTVRLYRTEVEYQGEMVESIRVKRKPGSNSTATKKPNIPQGPDDPQDDDSF
jgi:hypothetical protein